MVNSKLNIPHSSFSLPRYPLYKDSGVEWLGEIPEHWESEKGKWLFLKMDRPVRPEDGVVTAFRDGQVTLRTNRRTDGFTNAIKEHGYQGIRKGDLVIHAMDAFAGAIGVSESDGKSTPVYSACVPRKPNTVTPELYAYLLRYMAHRGFITTLAKGIRERSTDFRFSDFGALDLPLPPKSEQDRIVAFLDQKTAEIDSLIAKKQRQIELLDEQKAILINRAVTRGLNPNARLRPSGIEWIGDIPEHWEIVQLKRCVEEQEYGLSEPSTDEGDYVYLGMGQIQNMRIVPHGANRLNKCPSNLILRDKDLLFNRTNSFDLVGKTGIYRAVDFEFSRRITYASYLVRLRTSNVADPEWLNFLMGDSSFLLEARSMALRSLNQANLTFSRVGQIYVPLPPVEEQTKIVSWLNECFAKVEMAAGSIVRQIQSLKTLHSTLIAHSVTGRIKV